MNWYYLLNYFKIRKDISIARLAICVNCTAEKFTVGVVNILVVNLEKRLCQLEKKYSNTVPFDKSTVYHYWVEKFFFKSTDACKVYKKTQNFILYDKVSIFSRKSTPFHTDFLHPNPFKIHLNLRIISTILFLYNIAVQIYMFGGCPALLISGLNFSP